MTPEPRNRTERVLDPEEAGKMRMDDEGAAQMGTKPVWGGQRKPRFGKEPEAGDEADTGDDSEDRPQ